MKILKKFNFKKIFLFFLSIFLIAPIFAEMSPDEIFREIEIWREEKRKISENREKMPPEKFHKKIKKIDEEIRKLEKKLEKKEPPKNFAENTEKILRDEIADLQREKEILERDRENLETEIFAAENENLQNRIFELEQKLAENGEENFENDENSPSNFWENFFHPTVLAAAISAIAIILTTFLTIRHKKK